MGRHHGIQSSVLFPGRVAPDDGREGDRPPVWADGRPHRVISGFRQGADRELDAAQGLGEQLEGSSHLPQRHPAQRLLDRGERFPGLQREIGSRAFGAVFQGLHPAPEPVLKPVALRVISERREDLGTSAQVGETGFGIALGQQDAVLQDADLPLHGGDPAKEPRGFSKKRRGA